MAQDEIELIAYTNPRKIGVFYNDLYPPCAVEYGQSGSDWFMNKKALAKTKSMN